MFVYVPVSPLLMTTNNLQLYVACSQGIRRGGEKNYCSQPSLNTRTSGAPLHSSFTPLPASAFTGTTAVVMRRRLASNGQRLNTDTAAPGACFTPTSGRHTPPGSTVHPIAFNTATSSGSPIIAPARAKMHTSRPATSIRNKQYNCPRLDTTAGWSGTFGSTSMSHAQCSRAHPRRYRTHY